MITTPQLIDALSADLAPVRRLGRPILRCAVWLSLASVVLVVAGIVHGVRPDLAEQIGQQNFIIGVAASLATGILAAVAAFLASLPDRSRYWLLLPVPTLILWLSTAGQQCLTNWSNPTPGGGLLGDTARCFVLLVLTGLPLQVALLIMLRYAARLRPFAITVTGSLAIAAITAAALTVLRDLDATALVFMWNLGIAALIVGLGRIAGPRMHSRMALQALRRRG